MEQSVFGGRYKAHTKLGEGGMAFVYAALDTKLDRQVAIKVLHKHMLKNKDLRERFESEARSISQLDQPNIIKVYDFSGADSDDLWIVMELIDGWNLAQFVEQFPSRILHPVIAACIVREISKALAEAHRAGLVHRDIKPENIMIMRDGRVKLMDFGIVKDLSKSSFTQVGSFLGSPSYMSPEQVRGRNVDSRSDLYSLCVLFYELVTGQLPFTGYSTHEVVLRIIEGDYRPPRLLLAGIPADIDSIIVGGIQLSPGNRYQRIEEIGSRIDHFLESQGFVESHIELERFFKDRKGYLQKFPSIENFQANPIVNHVTAHETVHYQPMAVGATGTNQSPVGVTSELGTDPYDHSHTQRIKTGQKAEQNKNQALSRNKIRNNGRPAKNNLSSARIDLTPPAPAPSKSAGQPYAARHSQGHPDLSLQPPNQPLDRSKAKDFESPSRRTNRNSNFGQLIFQVFGIIAIGAIIMFSVVAIWQLQIKIDSNKSNASTSAPGRLNPIAKAKNNPTSGSENSEKHRANNEPVKPMTAAVRRLPTKSFSTVKKDLPARDIDRSESLAKISAGVRQPTATELPEQRVPQANASSLTTTPQNQQGATSGLRQVEIKVASQPASLIYVDGIKVGATNDSISSSGWITVSPGRRLLELKRESFQTHRQLLEVKSGDQVQIPMIRLKPTEVVSLTIKTKIQGIQIEISAVGSQKKLHSFTMKTLAQTVDLVPGSYLVKVSLNNATKERSLEIQPGIGPIVFDVGELI